MNRRIYSLPRLTAVFLLLPVLAMAQGQQAFREKTVVKVESGAWTGARLADGQPDVQGHWSNTIGNHNNLTDPQGGGGDGPGGRRLGPRSERAPSRVSDPADGEFPFQPWARAKADEFRANLENPTRPEYVEPFARCAPGGPSKSLMWHGYEIRQYPGLVVFFFDSGTRIIYLNNQAHLPSNISLWNGDSRGHWEGNTLVVDVANNNSKARFGRTGEFVTEHATVRERYIFDNTGERFTYEGTYTDPTAFTRPFTITIPNRRVTEKTPQDDWNNMTFFAKHKGTEPIFEAYERICVEGNGDHGQVSVESGR